MQREVSLQIDLLPIIGPKAQIDKVNRAKPLS
jgi:hypothetical protein